MRERGAGAARFRPFLFALRAPSWQPRRMRKAAELGLKLKGIDPKLHEEARKAARQATRPSFSGSPAAVSLCTYFRLTTVGL